MATDSGVGVAMPGSTVASPAILGAPEGISARPIPYPQPRPVTVEYTISASLPSWERSGDVLQVVRPQPELASVMSLARSSGVPSQTIDTASAIQTTNISWRDRDARIWTLDTNSRTISLWKDQPGQAQPSVKPPELSQDTVLKIASDFLLTHGFSSLASAKGMLQDQQYWTMRADMKEMNARYPCPTPYEGQGSGGTEPAVMMEASTVSSDAPTKSMMYPNPCGWWPMQINVVYSGTRDGKQIVDASGYPFQNATITVDLSSKNVVGGYIQLDEATERSSYPLIDAETTKKRLQSGGLNPVYPWGETSTIKVALSTLTVVWMRYDSWQDGTNHTYYLPALLATGKINRGMKGQEAEDYRTLVPLVADDAFDTVLDKMYPPGSPVPMPMPMMEVTPPNAQPSR